MLGQQRAPRVLIVDDTPEVRAFVSEALRTLGYEVYTAAGANEALELMARTRFKVVLCIELVEKLRRLDPDLAVIILTGVSSDDHDVRRLRDSGIAVLHKPVQLAQLHTTVAEVLRRFHGLTPRLPRDHETVWRAQYAEVAQIRRGHRYSQAHRRASPFALL